MSDILQRKPHVMPMTPGWYFGRPKGERTTPTPRHIISTVRRGNMVWVSGVEMPMENYEWFGPVPVCEPVN